MMSAALPKPRILELSWSPAAGSARRTVHSIGAVKGLMLCGIGLRHARSAVDEMMALGRGAVLLPDVPDESMLLAWLTECRCEGRLVEIEPTADALRRFRISMDLAADLDIGPAAPA